MTTANSMARKRRRSGSKLGRAAKACGGKGLSRRQFQSCVRKKMKGG